MELAAPLDKSPPRNEADLASLLAPAQRGKRSTIQVLTVFGALLTIACVAMVMNDPAAEHRGMAVVGVVVCFLFLAVPIFLVARQRVLVARRLAVHGKLAEGTVTSAFGAMAGQVSVSFNHPTVGLREVRFRALLSRDEANALKGAAVPVLYVDEDRSVGIVLDAIGLVTLVTH